MNTKFEQQKYKQGFQFVIGCDEVGRGSLAGPVVAATVALDLRCKMDDVRLKDIKDSKQLLPMKRVELASFIKQNFIWAIGEVSHKVIDKINIHHATLLAMRRAVDNLLCHCEESATKQSNKKEIATLLPVARNDKLFLVIDGKFTIPSVVHSMQTSRGRPKLDMEQEAVIDGDNKIFSIAAASIVAKVYRDELMRKMDKKYPQYGFAQHKGYGTLYHRNMVKQHGLSPLHRKSFCRKLPLTNNSF